MLYLQLPPSNRTFGFSEYGFPIIFQWLSHPLPNSSSAVTRVWLTVQSDQISIPSQHQNASFAHRSLRDPTSSILSHA
jgi:hypothetical protein